MMFNSSDIKNANNTLYEYRSDGTAIEHWYVVRDLGGSLGTTGRFAPLKNDPDAFERHPIHHRVSTTASSQFHYRGWHQELVRERITACRCGLGQLICSAA